LKNMGYDSILCRTHAELDLVDQRAVFDFFNHERPDYVFLAAAKVGGIYANSAFPADFAYTNLQIQNNVIHASGQTNVKKLLFLGSACIYPRLALQPMAEEALLTGPLEPTNRAYAIAKIAGIVLCQSYKKQYGMNFICAMPNNIYGPHDNYHSQNSHVLPALIRRIHEAKINHHASVTVWGSGSPLREFLYSYDAADACIFLMNTYDGEEFINIGTGNEVTISELVEIIKRVVKYEGRIEYDTSQPDGTPRKLLDCSRLHAMGWQHTTSLCDGIQKTYEDFQKNYRQ